MSMMFYSGLPQMKLQGHTSGRKGRLSVATEVISVVYFDFCHDDATTFVNIRLDPLFSDPNLRIGPNANLCN